MMTNRLATDCVTNNTSIRALSRVAPTSKYSLLFLLVHALLLCAVAILAQAGDTLQVPVRWCVVGNAATAGTAQCQGTPAFCNPGGVLNGQGMPEPDTDNVLWRRHERASDNTWIPGANITFRSGFTAAVRDMSHFPIIPDIDTSIGSYGDVVDPNIDNTETNALIAKCEDAWKPFNLPVTGPVAINIGHFVDKSGNRTGLVGWGGVGSLNADYCRNPEQITVASGGYVLIEDNQLPAGNGTLTLRQIDPNETLLAHELGHSLALEHGNGLDDDNNGVFDGYGAGKPGCDPPEDPLATPFSLMTPGQINQTITCDARTQGAQPCTASNPNKPSQAWTARSTGKAYAGAAFDPPNTVVIGNTVGQQITDAINDVSDPTIDLVWLTISENTVAETTSISHKVNGVIPLLVNNEYVFFADLDNNPNSGGDPSTLGFNTSFHGAELVTRVVVTHGGPVEFPERIVTPTVWVWQNSAFVQVNGPSIQASVRSSVAEGLLMFDVVDLELANSVRGPRSSQIRLQAIAHELLQPGLLDRLPDGIDAGAGVSFMPAVYPVCGVNPNVVNPGVETNVTATGLVPNNPAKVILGDIMVGLASVDANGNVNFNFVVPTNSRQGVRLMTVGSMGTALTADCSVDVEGTPVVAVPVPADIKPTSCPNPFNLGSRGTVPVAILGTSTFDVTQIDPPSVRLQGVAPSGFTYQDVATPFSPFIGKTGANACTTAGPDGFTDLSLKFDATQLASALGAVTNGQVLTLHLTGFFLPQFGGAPIVGEDVVVIKTK